MFLNIDSLNLKPIKDFDGYFISDCGKVVSTKYNKKRILKTTYGKKGYEDVKLCKNNKTTHKMIHRLVGEVFVQNPYNKPEIHHKDNNPKNNHFTNLMWVTRKENLKYSYKTMTPIRNFVKCEIHHVDKGFIKSFDSKTEACNYAHEKLGCSKTSLMRYSKSKGYKLIKKV